MNDEIVSEFMKLISLHPDAPITIFNADEGIEYCIDNIYYDEFDGHITLACNDSMAS